MNDVSCRVLRLAVLLALAGCAVGPEFEPPQRPSPDRYASEEPSIVPVEPGQPEQGIRRGAPVPARWWETFGSEALNGLVARSLGGSPTLESARATLAQAEHVLAAARGGAYPRVNLAASVQRSNTGAARISAPAANLFTIGPALDFTPDVFGGTKRRIEQAQALLDYQQAQWRAAQLKLAGDTVLQAIALASVNEQIAAVRDIIAVDERNLELVQLSTAAGKSARLDVLTAQSQLSSDQALLPPLLQQASVQRHALAVLAGVAPADWTPPVIELGALALPRELPLKLPSQWVRERPDIVAAEAQLHAANAAVGIASAQLYPAFTLSAGWTSSAGTVGGLFASGSNVWSIAAGLLAPIFDAHALASQRDAAIDEYAVQLGIYRQTLLTAFGEVADVLEALQHDASLQDAQYKALDAARATLDLTQQSYQAGMASLLQLLEAQRLYQQARLGHARARGQRYADSAQWFIAMGGSPIAAGAP